MCVLLAVSTVRVPKLRVRISGRPEIQDNMNWVSLVVHHDQGPPPLDTTNSAMTTETEVDLCEGANVADRYPVQGRTVAPLHRIGSS